MKKLAIIYSELTPTLTSIKNYLSCDAEVVCFQSVPENIGEFDLVAGIGVNDSSVQINVHHSLLPAFSGEEPLKEAFLAGVKVTGITFYYTNPNKIITQYPLFIKNSSHYDEVETEMQYLEQSLYPLVLKKVINNEPFELNKLIGGGCGNCGDCGKCNH